MFCADAPITQLIRAEANKIFFMFCLFLMWFFGFLSFISVESLQKEFKRDVQKNVYV